MPVFLDQFTSEDPVIAALYDQMSKYWKPKKSKRKAAAAEGADEEVSAEEQGSSESLDSSMEALLEDAYSAGDEQEQIRLASELGFTALVPTSPAGSLHTGITEEFAEKVTISSPAKPLPASPARPKLPKPPSPAQDPIEILDSPPQATKRKSAKKTFQEEAASKNAEVRRKRLEWLQQLSFIRHDFQFIEGCMYACMCPRVW